MITSMIVVNSIWDKGGGGQGSRNPGVGGMGSVREAREERVGDGIPKGVEFGRNRK